MGWGAGMRLRNISKGIVMAKKHLVFSVVIPAAILAACLFPLSLGPQLPPPRTALLAPGESIGNLDTLKSQLKQYHECTCTCGCYAKDLDLQADRAIDFLRARAGRRAPTEKLALVLDIDETTLSNYEEMEKADFAYDSKAFAAWIDTAKAPAIPGTLRIYQEAQKLGVRVFFLTGRIETQRAATEQNLRSRGFQNWQELILRSRWDAFKTAQEYKSKARGAIAAQGYKLVLNVGDQWSDLKGDPQAEFSVKYPDPFYFIP
jgi:acid phosphatase